MSKRLFTKALRVALTLGAVVRRFRPWRESQLISLDGRMIYTVRDRNGEERQVRHAWRNEWKPISKARFSWIENFEDYHRERFMTAVPYSPNT